jgi:hypothetical protein
LLCHFDTQSSNEPVIRSIASLSQFFVGPLGGELPKELAVKRKIFKELRRLYLRCGGKIRPLPCCEAPLQMPPGKGKTTPDPLLCRQEDTTHDPRYVPAMSIEEVSPVDVMTSDWIVVRDRQTRKCYYLYPNPFPPMSEMLRELNREVVMLVIEFEEDNEHHKDLIDNIIKIAKGDSE